MATLPPTATDPEEARRLEAVYRLDLLDTPEEPEYDELVRLAAEICGTPISTITIVDADRQWFKAAIGLTDRETPRSVSFCAQAIRHPDLFVVENAASHPTFSRYSNVTGSPGIRFYAGVPLQANGQAVGTLCVIDTVPRSLSESQRTALRILGRQVKARIELRTQKHSLENAMARNQQLNAELEARNSLLTAFMNNGPFISYIKDAQGRMVFYNARLAERFGVSQQTWIGRSNEELWSPDIAAELRRNDEAVLSSGQPIEVTEVTRSADGTPSHWRSYKFPFLDGHGRPMLAGVSIDITEQLRRQAQLDAALEDKLELARSLESSTQLFQTFVRNNPNICFFKSSEGRYLAYNSRFAEHFGIDEQAWIGKTDMDVRPPQEAAEVRRLDLEVMAQQEVYESVLNLANAQGVQVWHKVFKFPIRLPDGESILAGVALDITHEVEKEQALAQANLQLEQLATQDALTGLPNRRVFEQRIATDFAIARRTSLPLCLLMVDIDNFKKRNDSHGHAAGDEALRSLAQLLVGIIRAGDVAARIGGEEFAIVLTATPATGALQFADRLHARIRAIPCASGPITVSIGISTLHHESHNWQQLLDEADKAMYQAKRAGKDRSMLFSAQTQETAQQTPVSQ
jgi:diguanylate cyclase (GGDEF)-like protein/PAS domain S-box-containing protein